MNHQEMQSARRASSCRACRADGADIGAFARATPHTFADDCYCPEPYRTDAATVERRAEATRAFAAKVNSYRPGSIVHPDGTEVR